ncbi:hypothetical protein [Nocardioides ungokensis]|uniref:hypothetical protein n=1 Tax=Nocardioides ungokensis TaxID=1643322 RepID=UPI0015DEFD5B|nr:hypothetical protein [Nocardioides ungokensis]
MFRTAVLALALPALFACSSGNNDNSSNAPAGQTTTVDSPGPEVSVPEAQQLTEAELEDTLPTLGDMPAIFSPSKAEDDSEHKSFLCGADVEHFDQRNAEASVGYVAQQGLSAQQFTVGISQFDSPEVAAEQIRAFGDAIDKCNKYTSGGDTYTVRPMSAVRIGDDTVAARVTAKSAGFAVAVNVIMVRTGPSLVASLSATIGLAHSTIDDLVRLTEETVNRYEAAASIS